jgi:hypothetical protein
MEKGASPRQSGVERYDPMLAIRARYNGKDIIFPEDAKGIPPCNVIVLFEDEVTQNADWLRIQEQALAKAWDEKEDSIYDNL